MTETTVVDDLADLLATYKATKNLVPRDDAEARERTHELIRIGRLVAEAKRRATTATVEQRVTNDSGVTAAEVSGEIVKVLAAGVAPVIRELRQKVASIEQRIAPHEDRRSGIYQGEFSMEKTYQADDRCNVGGTVWRCTRAGKGQWPGVSSAWELCGRGR